VQYELQLKNGLSCGGAYLKLLTASKELALDGFHASTPYTIMFGPDKCGTTDKVHFIMRHKSPVTGEYEEKHLVTPPIPNTSDKLTHLYTAIVGADNSVKILVDNEEKKSVSLLSTTDFAPAINPPTEIDDPEDKKPEAWVDEAKIDDPAASKPDEWDEDAPRMIDDPDAEKPDAWVDDAPLKVPDPASEKPGDWDEDEDGEWEAPIVDNPACKPAGCGEWKAPTIANPDYKGKWFAPKIDNPDYIGVWGPKQIANPNFFEDKEPHAMSPIGGIGIELWTMQNGILFDNILVSTDPSVAKALATGTFVKRKVVEDAAKKEKDRAKASEGEGGFLKKAQFFVQDNLVAIGLTLLAVLLPLLIWCCWPRSGVEDDEEPAGPEEDEGPPAEEEPEPEPVEDVTEEVEEEKKSPKSSTRKRTQKASD